MPYEWIKWLNREHEKDYTMKDVTHWNWYNDLDINAFKWFEGGHAFTLIEPLPYAVEFFNEMADLFETHILTASSKVMKKPKDKHISDYFGDVSVIHHYNKWEYAIDKINDGRKRILIDDRPYNCIKWVENGGIAFLFNHNQDYHYCHADYPHENLIKVSSYEDIRAHIYIMEAEQEAR